MLASFSFASRPSSTANQQSTLFFMQDGAEKELRLALDDITKLIDAGREQGQLTYNDVKSLIPHDVHSSEDLGDLLGTVGTRPHSTRVPFGQRDVASPGTSPRSPA